MEQQVVVRAQHGDERAFEALVVAVHPRLFGLAHGILRDSALAEDAAQQAFLDIWRALPRLRDREHFSAWSYRLLLEAGEELAARHPERLSPELPIALIPRGPDPFGTVVDRDQVGRDFLRLSLEHRTIVVLRYLLDLDVEEIARVLAVSKGAAASRLERALAELRAQSGVEEGAATQERLAADLGRWLRESDITPPDARMSAGRVMAGVERARQLRRWWPRARSTPRVRPVPALGAPRPPESTPPIDDPTLPRRTGTRSLLTPPRVLAAALLLVLATASALLLPGLLSGSAGSSTMASPSPRPSEAATTAPSPTATPTPTPATSAESAFTATRVLMPLAPGAEPASLGAGGSRTAVFVDRADGVVYEVDAGGEARVVAGEGVAGAEPVGVPVLAARGGKDIVIFDATGQGWRSVELSSPGMLERVFRIDPATQALASTTKGRREYDLYLAEPASGDIVHYSMRAPGEELIEQEDDRTLRAGRPAVLDLYVDQHRYVLTSAGIERYVRGELDEAFALAPLPQGEPDYRYVDGVGRAGKGQLWLYDAAGRQVVAFDKGDGAYLGSWAPAEGEPAMADVRGLYVRSDGGGAATTVTWLTPDGLMRSELPQASPPEGVDEADPA